MSIGGRLRAEGYGDENTSLALITSLALNKAQRTLLVACDGCPKERTLITENSRTDVRILYDLH
jgi:hypothetical protein